MKYIITIFFIVCTTGAWAKTDTSDHSFKGYPAYQRGSVVASLSVGFADNYRSDYSLPAGYQKGNTSGFAPVCARLEYGLYEHVGLALHLGYDAFQYNFGQVYQGYNGPFTRYRTNKVRIWSGGVAGYYHLNKVIKVGRLDPFIGVGLSLNNIRYNGMPQGDTLVTKTTHTVTPFLKAGARYYISDKFSIYGDIGYEKQCIGSIGFSCRFFRK